MIESVSWLASLAEGKMNCLTHLEHNTWPQRFARIGAEAFVNNFKHDGHDLLSCWEAVSYCSWNRTVMSLFMEKGWELPSLDAGQSGVSFDFFAAGASLLSRISGVSDGVQKDGRESLEACNSTFC